MNTSHSDVEEQEKTVEDRAFDLTVRKMKSKVYPNQIPKHVSEMSKFTDYFDGTLKPNILDTTDSWKFKI